MDTWCIGHSGYPKKSFHADNGSEFNNAEFRALCRKAGITITFSPAYSPWSNGGCERRHAVVDSTIEKILEDNKDLSLQDAVNLACNARNVEIGPLGFSPQQLVYGEASVIPGITDGNISTDATITESEAVRQHFRLSEEVKDAYRKADNDA